MNHEGPAKAGPSALKRERIAAVLSIVILGLDPRIHPSARPEFERWILGSSNRGVIERGLFGIGRLH
jgi:hypothetical protein